MAWSISSISREIAQTVKVSKRQCFETLPCSQSRTGNTIGGLLPAKLAAQPLQGHFQVEPGNEILQGFGLS